MVERNDVESRPLKEFTLTTSDQRYIDAVRLGIVSNKYRQLYASARQTN